MSLDINQCKKYKKWGLGQDNPDWDSTFEYYIVRDGENNARIENDLSPKFYNIPCYKIPTLEKQLAFAVETAKEKYGNDTWFIISANYHHTINGINDHFFARITKDDEGRNFDDPDSQQAMFKLQEYISEVSDE